MNYNIKHALELLESQMKRLELSTALGMWDFAAYVLSEDENTANNVAHSYIALTQGEESYMSQSAINLWRGDMGETSDDAREICNYLRELRPPFVWVKSQHCAEGPDFQCVSANCNRQQPVFRAKNWHTPLTSPESPLPGSRVIECADSAETSFLTTRHQP